MNDELAAIAGKYEELVGRLQEKYGIAKEEADGQFSGFRKTVKLPKSLSKREKPGSKPMASKKSARKRI